MAIKPTKPTVPPAPSRSNPGATFSQLADAFAAFQTTLATYLDDVATFTDERADDAVAAALLGTLPPLTGQATRYARVSADGTVIEFRTAAQTRTDIGATTVGGALFTAASAAAARTTIGATTVGGALITAVDAAAARTAVGATTTGAAVLTAADAAAARTAIDFPSGLNATGTAPLYACRSWVNFNGTGTVAIRASGNVSSITDNGTGEYTVNFTTAMPDANYAVAITVSADIDRPIPAITTLAAGSIRIIIENAANFTVDPITVTVAIFR